MVNHVSFNIHNKQKHVQLLYPQLILPKLKCFQRLHRPRQQQQLHKLKENLKPSLPAYLKVHRKHKVPLQPRSAYKAMVLCITRLGHRQLVLVAQVLQSQPLVSVSQPTCRPMLLVS